MSDTLALPAHADNQLQFTDRTRHLRRIGKCPREAYLSTAFGPSGYGIARKRISTPLASGSMLHDAMGYLLDWLKSWDQLPDDETVRAAIAVAHAKYDATCEARGLSFWQEGDALMQRHILEQKTLISAMVWVWVLQKLPGLLADYMVVAVETEEVTVYDCTCGIGTSLPPWEAHAEKGCQGIALQTKADWIGELRSVPGHFTYHEFKTTGLEASTWADKWDTDIQPHLGTIGWQDRTGQEISGIFVHGILKGRRLKEKAPGDVGRKYTGPDFQDTRLIYGYCFPGTPPLVPDDWQSEYDWWDPVENRARKLGPKYQKRLVTDYPGGVEQWIRDMPEEERQKHVLTVGPILPNPGKTRDAVEGWVQAEQDTRQKVWVLHDLLTSPLVNGDWTHPTVQGELARSFPQSWNCQPYGRRHGCDFIKICQKEAGWQDPLAFLDYIPRRPHHEPELQQAIARGLLVPEDSGDDDDDG